MEKVFDKMADFIRTKFPRWSEEEVLSLARLALAAGEKARRSWTLLSGMTQREFVSRAMRAELERPLMPPAHTHGEDMPFVVVTDPQNVLLANRRSDEDEESHVNEIFFKERNARVTAALAKVPERFRTALLLRFYHNLTVEEVGMALGLSKSWASCLVVDAIHRFHILYLQCRNRKRWGKNAASVVERAEEALAPLLAKVTYGKK